MNDYDSDSSDGEQGSYTETSTLLGYATREPTGDCTKLGGVPAWIDGKTAPSGPLAKCRVCNGYMALLLQVNGDMPERFAGHERRLYVFICRQRACRRKDGSVRSIRGSRINQVTTTSKKKTRDQEAKQAPVKAAVDIGAALFGAKPGTSAFGGNPFSSSPSTTASNPFSTPAASALAAKPAQTPDTDSLPATFASKARISSPEPAPASPALPRPHEPWPTEQQLPPLYPELFLDAEYETLSTPATPQICKIPDDVDMGEGSSGGGGGAEDKELFESTMDKTFQKFADRIAANPDQVIRYEFRGTPLLYSDSDAVGKLLSGDRKTGSGKVATTTQTRAGGQMPRCARCGAERVFEVQLMPHAITELEADDMGVDGMEWGTVIVGVCAADCALASVGEVGYTEEWTGVQYEELVSKR